MSVFRFQATETSTPVARKSRARGSRSPPSFAFSTSPSILQDITMDKTSPCPSPAMEPPVPESSEPSQESLIMHDSDLSLSLDSSDDGSSGEMDARGATGLTMKEYDENLKKLTAENFQLKLKIYFLNERMGKLDGIQDKELINENIRLKVDNEEKAQEVERQSKLLIQALEAIEQIQSEHQQEMNQLIAKHQAEIVDAQVRAGALETRVRLLQDCPELNSDVNDMVCNEQLRDIQQKLQDSSSKVNKLESVNNELKTKLVQLEEDAKLAQTYSEEKTSLLNQIKTYQDQLLKLQDQETALETPHDELRAELSARIAELAELQTTYDRACDTIKSFVRRVLDERNENKRLEQELTKARLTIQTLEIRQKDTDPTNLTFAQKRLDSNCECGVKETLTRIKELEDEVQILKTKSEMGPAGDLSIQLMAKECEIETIKKDLKKRTHFLQELVNTELWDKNRQIEKLEKKLMGVDDVEQLKKDIKILSAEKRALSDELGQIKEKEMTVKEACFMLTKRLEELAGFLDSLISDRSLVELNGETCKAIRRAIDSSRELSRRLTLSFEEASLLSRREQISVVYCEDDSRRESEPFVITARESEKRWLELEMPDDSDEEEKPSSPAGIRKKVETFCARALGHSFKGEMDASESEAWSEPDRSVSLARMGHIDSTSVTPLRLSKSKNSSGSSEETLNETGHRSSGKRNRNMDSDMRKLQNKVKSLEETNKDLKAQLMLLENKHVILSKLNDHTSPQLLLEIQESLTELDDTRELCQRLKNDLAAARGDLAVARQDLDAKERLCAEQANAIAKMETKTDDVVLEYELRIIELTKEKDAAVKRAQAMEETLAAAETMRIDLESQVVEISRKLSEAHAWKDKSKAQVKEAGRHLDSCEKLLLEKTDYEKKIRELQLFVECLQKSVEEKQSEVDSWTARAQREHNEMTELKRRLLETERSKSVVESKIKEQGESMKWLEEKIREVEQATDQCGRETEAKIVEEVRRRVDVQMKETKKEWVPRVDLERAHKNIEALEMRLSSNEEAFKERADFLIKKLNRIETEKRDWWRQMNDLRLRSSEMEVELTRLANDKVRLEEELQKAVDKHLEVSRQHERAEATVRNLQKQVEYESSASGYTAASASFHDYLSTRNLNSSPDLGIESDQGRFSSLEHQDQRTPRVDGNMNRLEAENEELRQQLEKMGRDLEETAAELATANYQKKQMERAICKQLHKTHHMLKKARRNFEQDSDSIDDRQ